MSLVIQKFGGTSLGSDTARQRAVDMIEASRAAGDSTVVVVSAMGRKGMPYATDTLLALVQDCGDEVPDHDLDLISSCGEVISAVVIAQLLRARGIISGPLTGAQAGIITDDIHGRSRVKRVHTAKLLSLLNRNIVPVIAGFQGCTENGEITTLGRGGSDATASIIAEALGATRIEIITDVDGVMTADPRIVGQSNLIRQANHEDMHELAYLGSKVIHPAAVEIAAKAGIPMVIRSAEEGSEGTSINMEVGAKHVLGVTSAASITLIKIGKQDGGSNLEVFSALASADISVDFIDIRSGETTFVVTYEWKKQVMELLAESGYDFTANDDFVKVSVVGSWMTGRPGVMATVVQALERHGISIFQSTDSRSSISCLVRKEYEQLAVSSLHEAFKLDAQA